MTREMPDAVNEEAIAWFVRTHSDQRTLSDEDRFAQWLKQDSRHAEAYARVEKAWRIAGPDIAARPLSTERRPDQYKRRWARWWLTGLAAALLVLSVGTYLAYEAGGIRAGTFATRPGEQQTLELADGSRVILNTRSEVTVELGRHLRLIRLTQGEAHFQVARDASRPFIVDAGAAQVHALGTAFDVRVSNQRVAVTLVDGQVEITPSSALPTALVPTLLSPGQQFSWDITHATQRVETVNLARASAWIGRQLIFDATPLHVAVEEANRYLRAPIAIDDRSVQDIRVSGVVRAGNVDSFIATLESSFPVRAIRHADGSMALVRRVDEGGR